MPDDRDPSPMSDLWPPRDLEDIRSLLACVTYKPGWRFDVEQRADGVQLVAYSDELDSRGGPPRENFRRQWVIAWPRTHRNVRAAVVAWLRKALMEWECHEVNEWLRIDGNIVHDPHLCDQCLVGGCRA